MIQSQLLAVALVLGLAVTEANSLQPPRPGTTESSSSTAATDQGQHDFDFYFGAWRVHNHRLKKRLEGSREWEDFEATSTAREIWDGRANLDEFEGESPAGHVEGLTLRLYNPKTHEWSLYWANQKTGKMEPPLVGRFLSDRGEFFGADTFAGRPVLVRFIWSDISSTACHWEQAFSTDQGKTWETNWIMQMTRIK